jgi:hypothetical protein
MKNYSIVRIGNEYVVQADDKSILKVSSRRRAARLVSVAAELLESHPAPSLQADAESSITREPKVIPDPEVVLDSRGIPDPLEVS